MGENKKMEERQLVNGCPQTTDRVKLYMSRSLVPPPFNLSFAPLGVGVLEIYQTGLLVIFLTWLFEN